MPAFLQVDSAKEISLIRLFRELGVEKDDFVVVKMDIEMGEWTLIPAMKEAGLFSLIDEFMCEWHYIEPLLLPIKWDESGRLWPTTCCRCSRTDHRPQEARSLCSLLAIVSNLRLLFLILLFGFFFSLSLFLTSIVMKL